MKQLIAFNQAIAGTVHNFCLDNVRRGFGIDNKYASAWEAWEHTQQHPDRNIPEGLDVPLFYSYTADIDGVTKNYGHINVRLADGTVWSDGTIYPNLDAYLLNHWPKYVGWGESVNDFQIIEGGDMPLTPTQIDKVFKLGGITDFQEDLANQDYANNAGLLIDTVFNAAGVRPVAPTPADPSPTPPVVTPETPPTPVAPTPEPGQGSVQNTNAPVFPEIHTPDKSLLQIITDFLSSIIIGKKG